MYRLRVFACVGPTVRLRRLCDFDSTIEHLLERILTKIESLRVTSQCTQPVHTQLKLSLLC